MGPINWSHPLAAEMPEMWREAEQHPERFVLDTGQLSRFAVLDLRMYDGWPYWVPTPAVLIVSPMGTAEWRHFNSYGIGPGSMVRKTVSP
jgi:hypothetical protein